MLKVLLQLWKWNNAHHVILKAHSKDHDSTLIYGNKTKSETIFLEEINDLPITSIEYMYSREKVDGAYEGRIDKDNLTQLIKKTLKFSKVIIS